MMAFAKFPLEKPIRLKDKQMNKKEQNEKNQIADI